jgi:KaiC/GvpD/RAD55 family RecA-like ATPase
MVLPDKTMCELWGKTMQGVAIICGEVSGNLTVIDCDTVEVARRFAEETRNINRELWRRLTLVRTPNGVHVYFRQQSRPLGNQKLAMDVDRKTLIETRGQGGYVLAPGCSAECHPSGKTYDHIGGPSIYDIQVISDEEVDFLFCIARKFNEIEERPRTESTPIVDGDRPGDRLNREGDWESILKPSGWTFCGKCGDGRIKWKRPGKEEKGCSATTGSTSKNGNDLMVVFSTNADPIEMGSHTKFDVYAKLYHRGSHADAARELRTKWSYGSDRKWSYGSDRKCEPKSEDGFHGNVSTLKDETYKARAMAIGGEFEAVTSGIPELDQCFNDYGILQRSYVVLAAESGHGKTATALQVTYNWADMEHNCLIVSEEMTGPQLGRRVGMFAGTAGYKEPQWEKDVESHFEKKGKIYTLEDCVTGENVLYDIEKFIVEKGVTFVALDYLQIFRGLPGQRQFEIVSDLSRGLKRIVKNHGVFMLVLSQLNRDRKRRGKSGWRPVNSDLKDSSQIEHDSDVILFQVYPHRENPERYPKEDMCFFITKSRNQGLLRSEFMCRFQGDRQRLLHHQVTAERIQQEKYDKWEKGCEL